MGDVFYHISCIINPVLRIMYIYCTEIYNADAIQGNDHEKKIYKIGLFFFLQTLKAFRNINSNGLGTGQSCFLELLQNKIGKI